MEDNITRTIIDPVQLLKDEHRIIEKVLHALEWMVGQRRFDALVFQMALDFLRNFADSGHHAKEEDVLFPSLRQDPQTTSRGLVANLLDEHQRGRTLLQRIGAKLEGAVRGERGAECAVFAFTDEYIGLLRKHICFEDNLVFNQAAAFFGVADRARLLAAYERVELEHGMCGQRDRYLAMADAIWERAGTMVPNPLGVVRS